MSAAMPESAPEPPVDVVAPRPQTVLAPVRVLPVRRAQVVPEQVLVRRWAVLLGCLTTLVCALASPWRPLWEDERFTSGVMRLSPEQFHRMVFTQMDAVHATYYALLRWWTAGVGDSVVALRVPSAVFMGVACAGVVLLGYDWRSLRVGQVAGTIFALLPIVVRYGTEARSGALGVALVVWLVWVGARLVRTDDAAARWWWLYVGLLTLATYAFLYALLVGVAHAVATAVVRPHPKALRRVSSALGVASVLIAPLVVLAWQQQGQLSYLTASTLKNLIQVGVLPFGHGARPVTLLLAVVAWALIAFSTWRQVSGRAKVGWSVVADRERWYLVMAWLWAYLPGLVLIAVSLWKPTFTSRYVLCSVPAAALLLAWSLEQVGWRRVRAWLGPVLAVLLLLALPTALVNS